MTIEKVMTQFDKDLIESAKFLNCDTTDLVSTWYDSEDNTKRKIANFIGKVKDDGIILNTIQDSRWGNYMALEVIKLPHGPKIIFQNGMPDSIWYKKSDEQILLDCIDSLRK